MDKRRNQEHQILTIIDSKNTLFNNWNFIPTSDIAFVNTDQCDHAVFVDNIIKNAVVNFVINEFYH